MQSSTEARGNLCIEHGPPVGQVHGIFLASSKFGKRQVDGYNKKRWGLEPIGKGEILSRGRFSFQLEKALRSIYISVY